jgi:hypothetical protein
MEAVRPKLLTLSGSSSNCSGKVLQEAAGKLAQN